MALAAADQKHGTAVVISGSTCGQWELLERHPRPAHWWLCRWTADGRWETTYEHAKHLHRVASGSRHEMIQPELETAA
jgi:hypothetical protein